MEKVSC